MKKQMLTKVIALGVLATVGSQGVYAYFSDKAAVDDTVTITTGTLDTEANWKDSAWRLRPGNTEATVEGGNFTNVKPGDYFYRDVVVKNAGSLQANTTIKLNEKFDNEFVTCRLQVLGKPEGIIETIKNNSFSAPFMNPNQEYVFRMYIDISSQMGNEDMSKVINSINPEEMITITAEQLRH